MVAPFMGNLANVPGDVSGSSTAWTRGPAGTRGLDISDRLVSNKHVRASHADTWWRLLWGIWQTCPATYQDLRPHGPGGQQGPGGWTYQIDWCQINTFALPTRTHGGAFYGEFGKRARRVWRSRE